MNPERIPSSPPVIVPVCGNEPRPLWSVMIPSYNCSNYLKQTLETVLKQGFSPEEMQITVVDDGSTDADVRSIVAETGKGRIAFFQQKENAGSLRNFETCINLAKGKYIHLLHGDDQVKPGFYNEIASLFETNPSAGAAFTGISVVNEKDEFLYDNNLIQQKEGIIPDWLLTIARNQYLRTCAIVIKREVYEQLGSYYAVHYGEDWEMFVRIAANYPVAYSPESLAVYRLHDNNISGRYMATGQNIKDIKKVIEIIQSYLPQERREAIKTASLQKFSRYFSGNAQGIYKKHQNVQVALKQARGAFLLYPGKDSFFSLVKLYLKVLIRK